MLKSRICPSEQGGKVWSHISAILKYHEKIFLQKVLMFASKLYTGRLILFWNDQFIWDPVYYKKKKNRNEKIDNILCPFTWNFCHTGCDNRTFTSSTTKHCSRGGERSIVAPCTCLYCVDVKKWEWMYILFLIWQNLCKILENKVRVKRTPGNYGIPRELSGIPVPQTPKSPGESI